MAYCGVLRTGMSIAKKTGAYRDKKVRISAVSYLEMNIYNNRYKVMQMPPPRFVLDRRTMDTCLRDHVSIMHVFAALVISSATFWIERIYHR